MALPTSSRPPRASACRAGRPVTTAIASTWVARSTSTSRASGWMYAAAGSSTIGDKVPSKSRPTTQVGAARTSAAYLCSPPAEVNSMGNTQPRTGGPVDPGSAQGAGQDDREAVQPHGVDRRLDPVDPEVERQHLGRSLEPRRVVDGAGGDGAVP